MMRSVVFVTLLVFSAIAASAPARSQTTVHLTVQVIHASNAGTSVDPALAKIRAQQIGRASCRERV